MATMTKTLNLRVDADLKAQAEHIFSELGLSTTTAINMFLKAVVRYGGLPLDMRIRPNAETQQAIEEIEHGVGLSRVFRSTDELMEDLTRDA
ncbi:MAG: type II toxin-antitoxin system RelB/DinJ family antitoxin [Schwartzia sp.]|nr:type II toxin-antitoxin system RelB/DinJ family antitoxin [Schwartzia sp. (in: firmicutes)]